MKKRAIQPEYVIILLMLLIKTTLHLIADSNAGLDGDEIYHVETGNHLAWGYMEFPPMIGFLSWIQNLFNSTSVFVHHMFVHLASALIIVFCGLTVIKLGGKWKAILLCLTCIMAGSCFAGSQNSFQPVVFDQLFWVFSFYLLVSYIKTEKQQYLILLAISLALGFMTKYSILFFIAAVFISISIYKKEVFKAHVFWISVLLFLLLISPNLFWQWKHAFPVMAHFSRLYEVQLNKLTMADNLIELIMSPNPFTLIVWITGILIAPFVGFYKKFRLAFIVVLFSFVLLFLAKGKAYYFYPVILMSFITGSVVLEHFMVSKKWLLNSYITLLILMIPLASTIGIPILPAKKYIQIFHIKKNDAGVTPIMDSYSFSFVWEELNATVKKIFISLPEKEKTNCLIWGDTYSWASGINLYAETYNTPAAFSFHGTHYLWVPRFEKGITVIAINNSNTNDVQNLLNFYRQFFSEVELKQQLFNQYTTDKTDYYLNVFLCRDLKYDSENMIKIMKHRIFE